MMHIRTSRLSLLKLNSNEHLLRHPLFGTYHLVKDIEKQKPMPRGWEVELEQILSTITDPTLRQKITTILELARQGWLDQNGSGAVHNTEGEASSLLNNAGARQDFVHMPNASMRNHPNGPTREEDTLANPKLPYPSATNPNVQSPSAYYGTGYSGKRGKKTLRGSLLLSKGSNFLLKSYNPNFIVKSDGKNTQIVGYISNTLEDSDGERMHPNLITRWAEDLKTGNIHLDLNHDTKHVNSLIGHFVDSEVHKDGNDFWLLGKAKVDDSREDVKQIINLIKLGSRLGLSIEGSPKSFKMEKDIKVWTDVKLLGAGIVTNPSCNQCRTLGVNN